MSNSNSNSNSTVLPNISDKIFPEELKLLIDEYDLAKKSDEKKLLQDKIFKLFKDTTKFVDQSTIDMIYSTPEFLLNKAYYKYIKPVEFNTFTLSNHQLFLKKIFSPDTNINGMLLMHQTGSGKTCSALQIANNFKEVSHVYNKKTIIISFHDSIFKTELFDIRKYNDGYMKQCIENEILDNIISNKDKFSNPDTRIQYKDELRRAANRYINSKYFFKGYIAFYKYINRKFTKGGVEENYDLTKIINEFSNRIIIIDEIQHLRESMTSGPDSKKIIDVLKIIMKYGKNNKIIFLSATPMFNNYHEISLIMELLLLNDDINDTNKFHISIDKNGELDELSIKNLQYFANNYVSYVRGFNPHIYPVKLYPDAFKYKKILEPKNYPTYDIMHNKIDSNLQIKNLILIGSELSPLQKQLYSKYLNIKSKIKGGEGNEIDEDNNSIQLTNSESVQLSNSQNTGQDKEKSESVQLSNSQNNGQDKEKSESVQLSNSQDKSKKIQKEQNEENNELSMILSFDDDDNIDNETKKNIIVLQHYSNITYPDSIDILKNNIGSNLSIKNFFNYNEKENYFSYKQQYNKPDEYFLDPKNLPKYSPKIATIIENILNSDGIILVYSRLLEYGIIPLALALEHLGFNFCNNGYFNKKLLDPSLINKKGENIKPNGLHYTIISGDSRFSLSNKKSMELLTNENNKNGEKIKVVIISDTGTEGWDFKNLREIHILEPWYNLNKIEQIIGRGIRFISHHKLPDEKHNCMIFQHISLIDPINKKQTIESIDFRNYRISENKQFYISKVEHILKSYSLDCNINHEILIYNKSLGLTKNLVLSKYISNSSKLDNNIVNNKNNSISISENSKSKNKNDDGDFSNLIMLKEHPIYDKDFSKECDYQECAITCFPTFNIEEILKKNELSKLSIILYDINNYVKYISYIFNDKIIFNYNQIKNKLGEFINVHEKILQLALNKMIKEKTPLNIKLYYNETQNDADTDNPIKEFNNINTIDNEITRYKNINGYLIIKNINEHNSNNEFVNNNAMKNNNKIYYIFQPYNIEDEKLLLRERKSLPTKIYFDEGKGLEIELLQKYINSTNDIHNYVNNTNNKINAILHKYKNEYKEIIKEFHNKYVEYFKNVSYIFPKAHVSPIIIIYMILQKFNIQKFVYFINIFNYLYKKYQGQKVDSIMLSEFSSNNSNSIKQDSIFEFLFGSNSKINIKKKIKNILVNLDNIYLILQYMPHIYTHNKQVVALYFEIQTRTDIKKGQSTQKKFEYFLFENNNPLNIFNVNNPSRETIANSYHSFVNIYTKHYLEIKKNFGDTEKAFYLIDVEKNKSTNKFNIDKIFKTIRDEVINKKDGEEARTLKNYAEAGVLGGICKTQNEIPKLKELISELIKLLLDNTQIKLPKISQSDIKNIKKIVGGNSKSSSIQLSNANDNANNIDKNIQLSNSQNNNDTFNFNFNKKKEISFNSIKLIQNNIIEQHKLDNKDIKYTTSEIIKYNLSKKKNKINKLSLCLTYEYLLNTINFIDNTKLWVAPTNVLHYYIFNLTELNKTHGFAINKK